ncbi:MAG: NADH-quinone oxidoreductase subunit N, partial [Gaiellales bacterium]
MHTIPVSFSSIAPEIVLLVSASVLLTFAISLPEELARRASAVVGAGAFGVAGVIAATQFHDHPRYAFDHTLRIDGFGQGGRLIVLSAGLLAVAVSWGLPALRQRSVEYHALLLAAAAGMSLLCVANSFVTLFVALELFSVALYVLVAIDTEDMASLEGGLKYLIVGSVGAAFLLYGSALVYGATGQLEFDRVAAAARGGDPSDVLLLAGIALVVVGLGFKANAAPFHMWTPDVYEGAPTPVTAFMSAATKAVALVVMLRVLVTAFPGQSGVWEVAVAAVAIASFVVGNLAALQQRNVKRMLAYSTVG